MLNIKELVPFLIKIGLTSEEFLILHLKYLKEKVMLGNYKKKFYSNNKKILTNESRTKIVKLGYMKKDDSVEGDYYYLTEKFTALYGDEFTLGSELWQVYPAYIKIQGKNAPLMNTDFGAFRKLYYDTIEGLLHEHQEIMKDVHFALDNNMIQVKIVDFVRSQAWIKIRPIRLGEKNLTKSSPVQTQIDDHEF